jgi:hypothetical protein
MPMMKTEMGPNWARRASVTRFLLLSVTALLTGLLGSGCATLEGKVTSSKEADTSYFADQTISMLSSADLEMERDVTIYTREFFDANDPDEQRLLELEGKALAVFRVIIEYSLGIVRIANSRASESDQVQMYADWFGPWDDLALDQLSMDQEQYDNIIAEIREESDLRKAFLKAQPMLNALNLHMNEVLDEMVRQADTVAGKIDARIDAEFADVIRYQEALEDEKYAILSALEDVYGVYTAEKGAYSSLKKNRAIRRKDLLPAKWPNDAQIEKIVEHLLKRLEALHLVGQQIEPEWTVYRETHRELDALHEGLLNDIKTARLLTLIWVHAHYQMASGKTKPAEWFDIQDVGAAALKLIF